MKDSTIEYKVKVFISSKCGGRYTIVRKALKTLLLESNMASVYAFETEGVSSQNVISSYINRLDDSDLCVFLIDNADGIPDPVLAEHKRARELRKKSIYIFCDENKKEPTELQKEITKSLKEKYVVVHEFSDFIDQGYRGVIQDIVNIYRIYCWGQLANKNENNETDSMVQIIDTYKLDKQLFKGFDLTKNQLIKIVYSFDNEIKETSELDELFQHILLIVIGKKTIKTMDFESLKRKLYDIHDDFLKEFISSRINVISLYFNNDLESCLSELSSLYDKAILNKKIPNWLINDLLIDLRNIQHLIDETKSQLTLDNKGQKLLDENNENVYYPLLDRFVANINEEVLKRQFDVNANSPYSTSLGGLDIIFKNIASAFVVSVMYGSLTHILITRERLIEVLSSFCFIYRDHSMYIELLKGLLLCQKDKEIEKIVRAYNQTTDMLNESDIEYLLDGIKTIPIPHKQLISKFILFINFGYFFSNDKYTLISNELMDEIDRWINDNNRIFAISGFVFKALIRNKFRVDHNRVLSIIISIFNKGLKRWYDDAIQLVRIIDFSMVSEETEGKITNLLIRTISDEEIRNNCHNLSRTIVYIRKNIKNRTDIIDTSVKEYMADFYANDYSLEIFDKDKEDYKKHISRFIQTIHEQNEEQGKNGTFHGYMDNPYQTIRNIIEYDNLQLDWIEIKPIISAIDSTVFAPRQSIGAKISAIQLLIYLKNKSWAKNQLKKTFIKWLEKQDEILCGHEDGLFNKDSLNTLRFNFLMLKVCFNKCDIDELLSNLAIITHQTDYEIIRSLQCIEGLLYNADIKKMDASMLTVLTQYITSMSSYKEKDARFYSVKILLLLCRSNLKNSALIQLSRMMDNDIDEIKATILKNIKNVTDEDKEIIEYIIQKGKVDNHFLVRKIANGIK